MKKALVIGLFAVAAVSSGAPAHACLEAVFVAPPVHKAKPNPAADVARAEKKLDDGAPAVAAKEVLKAFPDLRAETVPTTPIRTRALRVLALATVRSEGSVSLEGFSADKKENLEWALGRLYAVSHERPNDPAMQADLAEAMSKLPEHRREALRILSGLAEKDLMGSPHAYAALARLRAELGDTEGSKLATARCVQMAKSPSVCGKEPARS